MAALKYYILFCLFTYVKLSTYSQVDKGLTSIPNGIPSNTKDLLLGENLITTVHTGRISHLSLLKYINLQENKLTQFPDVCSVGSTLTKIRLDSNPITSIQTQYISCLTELKALFLQDLKVTQFPDLSSIGSHLIELMFSSSHSIPITSSDVQYLDVLRFLTLDDAKLTSFPDVKPLGDTLEWLKVIDNSISSFPQDIIDSLVVIEDLFLDKNNFTANPDICSLKDTLVKYEIEDNPISHINENYVHCLTNLQEFEIGSTSLLNIDNLDFTLFKDTLTSLKIEETNLTSLPDMRNLYKVEKVYLNKNQLLAEFPQDFFDGWNSLLKVELNKNIINVLPSFHYLSDTLHTLMAKESQFYQLSPGNIGVLRSLRDYKLRNAQLIIPFLPPPCAADPSVMSIEIKGINVDLCACRHVWIKMAEEQGAQVEMDSVQCSGPDWSSLSRSYLYDLCDTTLPDLQSVKANRRKKNYYCSFPFLEAQSNMRLQQCLKLCMMTTGCYTFNFKPSIIVDGIKYGDCAIVAPSKSGNSLQTGMSDNGWDFYEVIGKALI